MMITVASRLTPVMVKTPVDGRVTQSVGQRVVGEFNLCVEAGIVKTALRVQTEWSISSMLAVVFVLVLVANSQAAIPAPAPLPPKVDFSSLEYFVGKWLCDSKSARRPIPSYGGVVYSIDPAGYFMNMTVTHKGTPWYPHDHVGTNRITYDGNANRWINIWTESDGGYGIQDSKGWKGAKFVWHDITPQAKGDGSHDSDYSIRKINSTKYITATSVVGTGGKVIAIVGACKKI